MKKKFGYWPLILFVSGVLGTVPYLLYLVDTSDEIQSKREWSILQSLELQYRNHTLQDRLLIDNIDEFTAVGVVSDDGSTRVWVLLNPEYKPLIKILPDKSFTLTPIELDAIKAKMVAKPAVIQYLVANTAVAG